MEEKFLKLTNAVYKVLEYFPESDPLKTRAKDKALAIMDSLVLVNETSGWASFQKEKIKVALLEDIDILLGYLWIAKTQKWLNSVNYLIIANEYEKIKKNIEPFIEVNPNINKESVTPDKNPEGYFDGPVTIPPRADLVGESKTPSFSLSNRQQQIVEFLAKNEKAQVMDLLAVLPNITKRTIRRDLDELMHFGKITRLGEFNQVFYKIKP